MDVPIKFGDSRSNGFREADFVSNENCEAYTKSAIGLSEKLRPRRVTRTATPIGGLSGLICGCWVPASLTWIAGF